MNTTRNETRSNNLREQNLREEEWTYEEPDALAIPEVVKARFDNEGMALRWIRVSLKGQDDITNVGKKTTAGWVFVTPDEVPEMAVTSFVREEGRYLGTVCRGDLALAKMPAGKVIARRKHYENKANDMMDAVNAQLMKNSDSRMPISNTSKSVTTRGRRPSFQN
jgi:hypothetical protein|tara:strand:+ start:4368 stop:4862 length:495 start_codon:yes stop_codon:yes gene_type:complete